MIRIPRPDDFHVHVRQGPAMEVYVRDLARCFGRGLVMPNTIPPILSPADVRAYKNGVEGAALKAGSGFEALMAFKIVNVESFVNETMGRESASAAALNASALHAALHATAFKMKEEGAVSGKLYPVGVTTNSSDGVRELEPLFPLFEAMQDVDLVLCVHAEDPEAFVLDRERVFLERLDAVVSAFPRLRIVVEHVSSADAVDWVAKQSGRVAATVTVHHLTRTMDDLLGTKLMPHLFCKPVLKSPRDRQAIQEAVLAGDSRFFFGSDSAPHGRVDKECDCGAAGVYSAPVALPILADFFAKHGKIELLSAFTSGHGDRFYGIPAPRDEIVLAEEPWTVPAVLHAGSPDLESGVVPLGAGTRMEWRVRGLRCGPDGLEREDS